MADGVLDFGMVDVNKSTLDGMGGFESENDTLGESHIAHTSLNRSIQQTL